MNYKIKVDVDIEELISLFSALGCKYFNCTVTEKNYMIVEDGKAFFCKLKSNFKKSECKEISIDQLKDMVVLKRNDPKDSNVSEENCLYDLYLTDSGDLYFYHCGKNEWILSNLNGDEDYYKSLKPIEKPMKEYLNKLEDGTYKLVLLDSVADGVEGLIEVPEGADTLAGDERTHYFWKHGVGKKGNMVIGVGESLTRYSGWTDCEDSADVWLDCVNDDSFKIIWQRETLNDKVASAEVARQEFIGAPFSDLPVFNFGAVDEFVESNVEQTLSERESTYGSFRDVADTTSKLMGVLLNSKNGQMLPCTHQEALHMICSKMARIVNGDYDYKDNWHDIGGYAKLIENLIDGV